MEAPLDLSQLSANIIKQTAESTTEAINQARPAILSQYADFLRAQRQAEEEERAHQAQEQQQQAKDNPQAKPKSKRNQKRKQKKDLKKKDAQAPPRDAQAEQLAKIGVQTGAQGPMQLTEEQRAALRAMGEGNAANTGLIPNLDFLREGGVLGENGNAPADGAGRV